MDQMPTPLLPRLIDLFRGSGPYGSSGWTKNRWFRRVVALVILVLIGWGMRQGVARVRENEVGVQINNLTGELIAQERVGYYVCFPYLTQFYVLDKTIQRLDLGFRQGTGGAGRDLKLKTADGSDVSLDVIIDFKVIPSKAAEVLRRSGPGLRFAETWIEPFARHICLSAFGQLTSEQMYDAAMRNEQAQMAAKQMNQRLSPFGIETVSVLPGEFRFYKEYEEVIQQKKLADQQVEEQQAQARAAMEDQERQLVEATKQAQTRLASVQGECENMLIAAKAEAEKTKKKADALLNATRLAADAALYKDTRDASGQKVKMLAEAEGMEQMRKAMVGDGGLSMIGMEYARHLSQIKFSATPIARDPSVHQFAVQPGEAAAAVESSGRPPSAPADGVTPPSPPAARPRPSAPMPNTAGPRTESGVPQPVVRPAQPVVPPQGGGQP